jgi:uncharacterized membrane protein
MTAFHIIAGTTERPALPRVRSISIADLRDALAMGFDDFRSMPTHAIFLCIIYPVVGLFFARLAFGYGVLPLLFPLAAGFALIGPFAAIGLYELSRRREAGLDTSWTHAFDVLRSPAIGAIAVMALLLMVLFLAWLATAQAIYQSLFGVLAPKAVMPFLREVFTTAEGFRLIYLGVGAGFIYAVIALAVSVVSFPLLIDRDVGAAVALLTSVRVVLKNPSTMLAWGAIVVGLLIVGSLPFFIGLAVVLPLLGHATWHLYRKVIIG